MHIKGFQVHAAAWKQSRGSYRGVHSPHIYVWVPDGARACGVHLEETPIAAWFAWLAQRWCLWSLNGKVAVCECWVCALLCIRHHFGAKRGKNVSPALWCPGLVGGGGMGCTGSRALYVRGLCVSTAHKAVLQRKDADALGKQHLINKLING